MAQIDKAKNDSRVTSLLEDIRDKIKLQFIKTSNESWGSNLLGRKAEITHCSCNHPSAALAHELLHLKTQLGGYRRLRIGISSIDQSPLFQRFMTCLDNELQHHKFYNEFISLSFKSPQFYCDSDSDTEKQLQKNLSIGYKSLIALLPDFFTSIAPGGSASPDEKNKLKGQFLDYNDRQYESQLVAIERLVRDWAESDDVNAESTVKKIMLTIEPINNLSWFGYSEQDRPPQDGFFVDQEFEVNEP